MYMKIKFFSMAIVGLLFAACSNNDVVEPTDLNNGNKPIVSFSLANASTRLDDGFEAGTTEESKIEKVIFYVFTSDGTLLQTNEFTKQSLYKFAIDATAAQLTGMNFLVGVNQDLVGGTTFADVKKALLTTFEFDPSSSTIAPYLFPMTGEALNQSINVPSASNESPVTPLTIKVTRLVSKVEAPKENTQGVALDPSVVQSLFGEAATGGTFTLDGYVFINGIDKSDAFHTWTDGNTLENWNRDNKTNIISTFDGSGAYTNVYAGDMGSADYFITDNKTVYVFENRPEDDAAAPSLYFDKSTVYSFIIKGTIASGGEAVTRYWRANLIPDDSHVVVRNAIYRLTIDSVNTVGYETPEQAEEQEIVPKDGIASVSITIEVLDWRVKLTNTSL